MTDLAKYAALPWDVILGAELVRHYKPDREVYQSAADILDLKPADVMMVAAHLGDLRAAKAGRAAHGVRGQAEGVRAGRQTGSEGRRVADVSATDFNDLARQLGA